VVPPPLLLLLLPLLLLLQSARDIVLQEVPEGMSGHILVIGMPRSQEALLALLAPLRSR
jgi:hypothetical protein